MDTGNTEAPGSPGGAGENNQLICLPTSQGGFMNSSAEYLLRRYKSIAITTIAGCSLALLVVACQNPDEKVAAARTDVATANQDLKEAKREVRALWQEDWLKFKRDYDVDIAANERRFIELKEEVNGLDVRYRNQYRIRINELEPRNNELRERVNNAKDEGDAKWEEFKKSARRDMDELKVSLKSITIRNS
jgi:hypothetical protein